MAMISGRWLPVAAAIPMTAGVLSLASAWVFDEDDRRPSHSALVGTLEVILPEGSSLGTAALVDQCGILTSFHVVFGPWYVTALRPPSREFSGRFTLTEVIRADGTHPSARAIPVVWGEYRGPDRQLRIPDQDWAYLVLDPCLGVEYGHLIPRALEPDESAGAAFAALGYSTGRQMIDPACSLEPDRSGRRGRSWRHDCTLQAGDSGGPIIRRGTLALVALSVSMVGTPNGPDCRTGGVFEGGAQHPPFATGCANLAVPLGSDLIARIDAARIAAATQRVLADLGYDAGPIGAIDAPRAVAAIKEVQRDMGWPVTGTPSDALRKILWLRLRTS